jgi:hypothetical protein
MSITDLFLAISNQKIGKDARRTKHIEQRDLILWLFKGYTGLTYQQLENVISEYDFNMSYQQIQKICAKFGEISLDKVKKSLERIKYL